MRVWTQWLSVSRHTRIVESPLAATRSDWAPSCAARDEGVKGGLMSTVDGRLVWKSAATRHAHVHVDSARKG